MITFVSENYSLQDSIIGLGAFAFYFALGLVMLFVYSKIYLAVTPHDEIALIKENKLSAGVSFAGSMIGFCFPLITSMNQSPCVADFLLWSVISIVAQVVGFLLVRLIFPIFQNGLSIEDKHSGLNVFSLNLWWLWRNCVFGFWIFARLCRRHFIRIYYGVIISNRCVS